MSLSPPAADDLLRPLSPATLEPAGAVPVAPPEAVAEAAVGLPGRFHEPTVVAGEPRGARIAEEGILGPTPAVVRIANEEDGIRLANDSRYGLGASVWTRDRSRTRRAATRLEAGSVWTNDQACSYGVFQAPWGGRKESGLGRTHSRHGLYALSHLEHVDADAGRPTPPSRYPYIEGADDGFRGALPLLFADGARARLRASKRQRRGLVELGRRTAGR